jgi:glycosyltransferase involved in cell wall biosynthesis
VAHAEWLEAIAGFDGAICVSRAVADDLSAWRAAHEAAAAPRRPYRIACSHHGADFTHSAPSRGLPADAAHVLAQFTQRPTLLAVGTVEPRKGYLQLLDAFTLLWQAGVDVNLAIVGPEGWKSLPDGMRRNIPETVQCLRGHPERNRRLYWLEGISDEYLEQVYAASSALIAASLGEGFGLPLIEAAQHRRPIIARDLPVFREVAGAHASYFNANSPTELADFLQGWLAQFAAGTHIRSTGLLWLTWQQSATNLKQALAEWDALSPPCS